MSRIGNAPVAIPSGVTIAVDNNNVVTVKGTKGELSQKVDEAISINIEGEVANITRTTEAKKHKALHGLYRTLLNNMVTGVSEGYKKELELVGVGYRASASGQTLELAVGYSHPIMFSLPKEIKVSAESKKGNAPLVTLESHDKQLMGQVAAKIRSFRSPEPYKGKGVRYKGEHIRRKAGKTAG